MKVYHNKQSQFELFPAEGEPPVKKTSQRFFLKDLTFSPENFIVLSVVLIMSMVVFFSLGVERGKRTAWAKKSQQGQRTKTSVHPDATLTKDKTRPANGGAQTTSVPRKRIDRNPIIIERKTAVSRASGQGDTILEKNADKVYTVQVASFRKEEYAQKEAMDLKKKGYEILVLPKGKYSIVCVGKFAQRDEAKLFSKKLRKRYKDCLIRSL